MCFLTFISPTKHFSDLEVAEGEDPMRKIKIEIFQGKGYL
jgi:hypothetical protein